MMKRTIKQWCGEHKVNWLGQGSRSHISYDWKLVLRKGRSAIFSSAVESSRPEVQTVNQREIFVFPNVNCSRDNGKISETAFLRILSWVEDCLDGNVRELESSNQPSDGTR